MSPPSKQERPTATEINPAGLPVRCLKHRALAGWKCDGCQRVLCPDCVATRNLTGTLINVSVCCRALAAQITLPRRRRYHFPSLMLSAFKYPLNRVGLMSMLGVGIVSYVLLLHPIGLVLSLGVIFGSCYALVRQTARGSADFEPPDFVDTLSDILWPATKGLIATAPIWLTLTWWLLEGVWGGGAVALLARPGFWLMVLFALSYLPIALLVAATNTFVLRLFNPVALVAYIRRIGADYGLMVAALVPLALLQLALVAIAGAVLHLMPVPFLPSALTQAVACYVPFVFARMLGSLLFLHGDKLEYGVASDYQVPVLPGVEPRGVLSEDQQTAEEAAQRRAKAPLELEEPEPAAAPPPAPARPLALDAEALAAPKTEDVGQQIIAATERGDADEALALYRAAREAAELPAAAHFHAGRAAAVLQDFQLSAHAFAAAAEKTPDQALASRALVLLGRVHREQLNDVEAAHRAFQQVIDRYPDTPAAAFVHKYLAEKSG